MSMESGLRQGLSELSLSLDDEQIARLLAYLELLQKWNRVYNLTAVRDPQQMLTHHLLDSLAAVPPLQAYRRQHAVHSLLDVGSGGGGSGRQGTGPQRPGSSLQPRRSSDRPAMPVRAAY